MPNIGIDSTHKVIADTVYSVSRDTIYSVSHHLLDKENGVIDIAQIAVAIATLIIVAYTAYQGYKLLKLNNSMFEAEHRPYCSVALEKSNYIRTVSSKDNTMYMTVDMGNDKDTFAQVIEVRHYLQFNERTILLDSSLESFVLVANSVLPRSYQLHGNEFKSYKEYIVEIRYIGVTGKEYYHRSFYTYDFKDMGHNIMSQEDTIRFTFCYSKSVEPKIGKPLIY